MRNKRGFTLIELTITMAVLTILAGAAMPVASKRVQIAYAQKAASEMNILQDAAKNYYASNDTWPNTVQEMKDDGYLSSTWVAKNAWGNDYVITPAADGKSFSVASNVPSDLVGVLEAALPQSSSTSGTITSVIPIPGEEASLQALVHRSSDDPKYREMSQRLVTPTVAGRKIAGKDVYGMNYDPYETDDELGAAGAPGVGRMKDIWIENLNNKAGGYVGDIGGGDIAVGTGVLYHGNQIPLPYFSDGTQATQAQCKWIVSKNTQHCGGNDTWWRGTNSYAQTSADRVIYCVDSGSWGSFAGWVNYIIIGVRA